MKIFLKKFGSILISRPAGREAFLAFQPLLRQVSKDENIEIDFEDVKVLTPAWADEFLTPLAKQWKTIFLNTKNSSIEGSLKMLEKCNKSSQALARPTN
jgi:hypothetical protein